MYSLFKKPVFRLVLSVAGMGLWAILWPSYEGIAFPGQFHLFVLFVISAIGIAVNLIRLVATAFK